MRSVLQPTEIYFSPYGEDEVRGILESWIRTSLYPGVMPPSVLDLVVAQTMKCGDLRVGLDLVKRSVLSAEKDARQEVGREDVCAAYEVSKSVHLSATVEDPEHR